MPFVSLAGLVQPVCKIQHQCELLFRQCDLFRLFCSFFTATRSRAVLHNSQALLEIPYLQLVPVAFKTLFHVEV
jgi:hypothetical protein